MLVRLLIAPRDKEASKGADPTSRLGNVVAGVPTADGPKREPQAANADVLPLLQLWGRDVWLERYWRMEASPAAMT